MPILRKHLKSLYIYHGKRAIREQAETSTSHWQLEENPFYYEIL